MMEDDFQNPTIRAIVSGRKKPTLSVVPQISWREQIMTARQLQQREFPPISYVMPGLIPEGLSLLVGRPKLGKSWMGLDICIAIAGGRFCLGERKPTEGDVLYCALEDNPRRLRRRIDWLLPPKSHAWPERLTLATEWRRLDKGGVDDLQEWAESVPKPRLIVLDTLAGVRPVRVQNGYTEDYESVVTLHRLANKLGIGILVLHHTRKMEADDPIDTVSGTLGLPGCADTILVLNRTSQGTTLYVRGRDVEEAEHAMTFDKIGCRWTILGDATEVHRSKERGSILAALWEASEPLSPQEIAIAAGMPRGNVDRLLHHMANAGEVVKIGRGQYRHPSR
jgi:hypothetical protein